MTEPANAPQDSAPSVGQTGGLPGANAAPETAELRDDEAADTVNIGDTAPTGTRPRGTTPTGTEDASSGGENPTGS